MVRESKKARYLGIAGEVARGTGHSCRKYRRGAKEGETYGRLTVLMYVGKDRHGHKRFLCRCLCGTEKVLLSNDLSSGRVKSCGCLKIERARKLGRGNRKHGLSHTRLYTTWTGMVSRCENPKDNYFKEYGGRGIAVCQEWKNFENFYAWAINNGYDDRLTIDRIDNEKGYTPNNCRWATVKEQSNNRRSNNLLTYCGKTQTLKQWSEELGINYQTLQSRVHESGWSTEKALSTPVRRRDNEQSKQAS